MRGEVVGINSSIRSVSSSVAGEAGSIGLGFAIPMDNVLPIVDQLRNGETPTHARLGVSVVDANSNDGLLTGAGIGEVSPGSAAEEAGLEQGDVITKVDDQVISDSESLVATIRGHRPGDEVTLTVVRGAAGTRTAQRPAARALGRHPDRDAHRHPQQRRGPGLLLGERPPSHRIRRRVGGQVASRSPRREATSRTTRRQTWWEGGLSASQGERSRAAFQRVSAHSSSTSERTVMPPPVPSV